MTGSRTIGELLEQLGAPAAVVAGADRSTVRLGRSYVSTIAGDLAPAHSSRPTYSVRSGRWRAVLTTAQHDELRRLLS